MEKQKNSMSSFSNPKEYELPKVLSSGRLPVKRKNRISTFSSPKEYALPKILPSERGPVTGKFSSKFPYIFKSLEVVPCEKNDISENIDDCANEIKEDNIKVRKRTRND